MESYPTKEAEVHRVKNFPMKFDHPVYLAFTLIFAVFVVMLDEGASMLVFVALLMLLGAVDRYYSAKVKDLEERVEALESMIRSED